MCLGGSARVQTRSIDMQQAQPNSFPSVSQDEDDDENYNPFATLFGRISIPADDEQGQGTSKRPGTSSGEKQPKVPKLPPAEETAEGSPPRRNSKPAKEPKKRAKKDANPKETKETKEKPDETEDANEEPGPKRRKSLNKDADGDGEMTSEDAELIQRFQQLSDEFVDMNPEGIADEVSLKQWLKASWGLGSGPHHP